MDTHLDWFKTFRTSSQFSELSKAPIAYFCAEFAISEYLQIYAGGLGILAADVLREAQDQQIPMVAVGIFYRQGYLHHEIHEGGAPECGPLLSLHPAA
jgi:glucan phosphorylase